MKVKLPERTTPSTWLTPLVWSHFPNSRTELSHPGATKGVRHAVRRPMSRRPIRWGFGAGKVRCPSRSGCGRLKRQLQIQETAAMETASDICSAGKMFCVFIRQISPKTFRFCFEKRNSCGRKHFNQLNKQMLPGHAIPAMMSPFLLLLRDEKRKTEIWKYFKPFIRQMTGFKRCLKLFFCLKQRKSSHISSPESYP